MYTGVTVKRARRGYQRLHPVQVTIIGVVGVLTLMYGTYHISTEGKLSGTIELATFVLMMWVLLGRHESRYTFRRFTYLQVALLAIVALPALGFGIYHLTRPDGLRSGIMELSAFTLLALALLLPFRE